MDGWGSVEDLTRWAFARSPVVIANEAHHGLLRCPRTRRVGVRMVRAAHDVGVRRLAMEALPRLDGGEPGPIRTLPQASVGYLAQPEMRELISAALDLGWSLWAYEMQFDPDLDAATALSADFTNRREAEQARQLCALLAAAPGEPMLVWCGNGHGAKEPIEDWTPMGHLFRASSGVEPFVIDQAVTVDWPGTPPDPWLAPLLADLAPVLERWGGAAGIRREQAPWPWHEQTHLDAVVVAADNAMV
jgi:hypothetical protein